MWRDQQRSKKELCKVEENMEETGECRRPTEEIISWSREGRVTG